MPVPLSHDQYIRQCERAAYSSRLSPHALHAGEQRLLKLHLTSAQIGVYLTIRNAILRLWTRNPLVAVTRDEAAQCTRAPRHVGLAIFAHEWLARCGYINFGCVDILPGPPRKPANVLPRQTIVVIGAGMSGLSCARQLTALFGQFPERWTKQQQLPIPRVVVLEGRGRIGGRLYSHPLKHQDPDALPDRLSNTVELGAQIITGFERGNPLDCILRGQLALHYHTMKDNMILYDHDGSAIDTKRDKVIQDLFNDFLESAARLHGWKAVGARPVHADQKNVPAYYDARLAITGLTLHANRHANQPAAANAVPAARGDTAGGDKARVQAADAADTAAAHARDGAEKTSLKPSPQPSLGELMDAYVNLTQSNLGLSSEDLRMLNWHFANLEYANAANVHKLSLGGWDQDSGNEFEGRHAEVIGGYGQIPRALYQQPEPLDVQFHKVVKEIVYTSDPSPDRGTASVLCEDGDVFDADYVVCTLPLGVLQNDSTLFSPALPAWKLSAMQRLGFGLLNKVVLVFDHVFWHLHRDMFGLLNTPLDSTFSPRQADYAARRGRFYLFWNCAKTSGLPVLVALMAGDSAAEAECTPAAELVAEITARLASIFRLPESPTPREVIVTRWGRDRFARGVYSYLGPEAEPGDYGDMARGVGNLHFAGEATCGTHPATVHGAYLSGLRAAAEVVEAMVGPVPLPSVFGC